MTTVGVLIVVISAIALALCALRPSTSHPAFDECLVISGIFGAILVAACNLP